MSSPVASLNASELAATIEGFTGRRVLLVGDLVADHYIKGKSSRISREAPVLILKYQEETIIPGQVGNTAANVAALGGEAKLVAVLGRDTRGDQLNDALNSAGVNLDSMVQSQGGCTLTKTRILAGGHHAARQQVIRIDDDERMRITAHDHQLVMGNIESAADWAEAIIVSDYGYGVIDQKTWELTLKIAEQRNIPLVLDSRYNLTSWKGATLITPNEEEALAVAKWDGSSDYCIDKIGETLRDQTECRHLIITRGNEGLVLFQDDCAPVHLPIFGSDECTDVTGAGDTVVATASLALAGGATPQCAMALSNLGGSLVVMKLGTATVSQLEMKNALPCVSL